MQFKEDGSLPANVAVSRILVFADGAIGILSCLDAGQ